MLFSLKWEINLNSLVVHDVCSKMKKRGLEPGYVSLTALWPGFVIKVVTINS